MNTCGACKNLFEPNRAWQKYCSAKCRGHNPAKSLRNAIFQQSRRDIINNIKLTAGCAKCGYKAHSAALDFNHVSGDKKFNVSQDPKVALEKLFAEISKCEILCANCHRVVTYEKKHWHTKRKVKQDV
jgi:hypothetical protein